MLLKVLYNLSIKLKFLHCGVVKYSKVERALNIVIAIHINVVSTIQNTVDWSDVVNIAENKSPKDNEPNGSISFIKCLCNMADIMLRKVSVIAIVMLFFIMNLLSI